MVHHLPFGNPIANKFNFTRLRVKLMWVRNPPIRLNSVLERAVCTENLIRVDDVMDSPKLAE